MTSLCGRQVVGPIRLTRNTPFAAQFALIRITACETARMATDYRSPARSALVTFRTTVDEKARLKREAAEAGLTLTQLFELRMLGYTTPVGKSGPQPQSERLDISA